jgi:NAD(P)H-dependent FMN reductase
MGKQPSVIRLLALSGSLRAASYNSALLRAAARLVPAGTTVELYEGIGRLPAFNPDLDSGLDDKLPPAVAGLRTHVGEADGLLIASPEYAHGVSGIMKNALDWLVAGEEFVHKPVALFNASPRASHAYAALRETVVTMNARLVPEASIALPLLGSGLDADGIVANPELSRPLAAALSVFADAIRQFRIGPVGPDAVYTITDDETGRSPLP